MAEIRHRFVEVGGLHMHLAEAGEGPLVLLLHGFPECWYSWRHQLVALADAGFHAVAPDQRGYARTGGPDAVDQYSILHLVGDVVGLIAALDEPDAVVVGHDWGAPVAWHTALLRPDLVRAVAGLSVPPSRRSPVPTLQGLRARFGPDFYQLYFQQPGVEKDFEADPASTFRRSLVGLSGDAPEIRPLVVPPGSVFTELWPEPGTLPGWITEDDVATYVEEYATTGFGRALHWYRNLDRNWEITAAWDGAPITPPSLLLIGDRDPVVAMIPPDRLTASVGALLPGLRGIERIAGAGHWLQQERPRQVDTALVELARAVG
jgi:pimeloyl-ACP methyl ester carboxylesterase